MTIQLCDVCEYRVSGWCLFWDKEIPQEVTDALLNQEKNEYTNDDFVCKGFKDPRGKA